MKIIQLISSLAEGGAENLVKDYALEIKKSGHEIAVVTTDCRKEGKIYDILITNHIRVVQMGGNWWNLIKIWTAFLKEFKPDIIHGHLKVGFFMILSNRKTKLYYTMHNQISQLVNKWGKSFVYETKYLLKVRKMMCISLCEKMTDDIKNYFDTKNVVFLENCINIKKFQKKYDIKKYYSELRVSSNAFIIGHIGRFTEAKNHKRVIDIFEKVLYQRSNAHLILIGVGELEDEIYKLVQEKNLVEYVHFLGKRTDIPELLQFMDVFILPSLYEGFPITVIEAQAAQTYTLVSNATPIEAIRSAYAIRLDLAESDEIWTDAILKWRGNHEEPKYKLEDCESERVVKKLIKYYTQ